MAELSGDKLSIMVALMAQLVVATTKEDPVIVLTNAGMSQSDVAKLLAMNLSTVSMRVSRSAKPKAVRGKSANKK